MSEYHAIWLLGVATVVWAAEPDDLRIQRELASRYAARKALSQTQGLAARLGSVAPNALVARLRLEQTPYRPGQSWSVAVAPAQPLLARKGPVDAQRQDSAAKPLLYHFRVDSVAGGLATVSVVCEGRGQGRLTIDSRRRVRELKAGASLFGFDLFPASIPQFPDSAEVEDGASVRETDSLPALPAALAALGSRLARPTAGALAFEGPDAFARPVRVVWGKGEPWPTYLDGPAGTAVLLKEER